MLKIRTLQVFVLPSPLGSIFFLLHPALCPGCRLLPSLSPRIPCWVASDWVLLLGSTSKGLKWEERKVRVFPPPCSWPHFLEGVAPFRTTAPAWQCLCHNCSSHSAPANVTSFPLSRGGNSHPSWDLQVPPPHLLVHLTLQCLRK